MFSIGKHISIFLDTINGILFCDRYDYKFNHLVIVTFTGSFTCVSVTGASNHELASLELCVKFPRGFIYNLSFYSLHITTRTYGV